MPSCLSLPKPPAKVWLDAPPLFLFRGALLEMRGAHSRSHREQEPALTLHRLGLMPILVPNLYALTLSGREQALTLHPARKLSVKHGALIPAHIGNKNRQ